MSHGDLRMRMFTVASGIYLSAAGHLDSSTAYLLRKVVTASLQQFYTTTLAVDVSAIVAIDAHGVGMLAACRVEVLSRGVRFTLANPTPKIRRMIDTCGEHDLLEGVLVTATGPACRPARRNRRRSGASRRPPGGPCHPTGRLC